jgi:Trafficking protein Mon1.
MSSSSPAAVSSPLSDQKNTQYIPQVPLFPSSRRLSFIPSYPSDIHILLNTIHTPSILNSPASSSYIPVCLPKFNPSGYVNAYISFPRKDDGKYAGEESSSQSGDQVERQAGKGGVADLKTRYVGHAMDSGIAMVCISGGGDFDTIRGWCDTVTQVCFWGSIVFCALLMCLQSQKLESEGILDAITLAFRSGQTDYNVSELGIPGLRHFVYKSRAHVQVTFPVFEDPYDDIQERRRCVLFRAIYHSSLLIVYVG